MGRKFEVRKVAMAKTAGAKTKVYSKYGKEIYMVAKNGGTDPQANLSLRRLIDKAKKDQVPSHVIDKAIDKAAGGAGEDFTPARYEGFGPGGCMVIVDCLTDNNNRTITDVRNCFTKTNSKIGVTDNNPELEFDADEITFVPQTETAVTGEDVATFDKFMDMLEDCDDVQDVYHNAVVEREDEE